ncbi:MAG: carboxymuconolactone decarboxylase family protein [Nitrospira sp.]|nr:carboxymuconolactone decarboxylase family protein [Nitrospira sp.]
MIQRLVERKVRVSVDYLGRLGEVSFPGFLKLLLSLPLASHRAKSDPTLLHAARIVATQQEDCASCLQMVTNVALDEGMEPQTIRAVLNRDDRYMSDAVALVVKFTEGVLARNGSEEELRQSVISG